MQNVLLIGFGFMGKMHAGVYRLLPDVRVVGVVESRAEAIRDDLVSCGLGEVAVFADMVSALGDLNFSVVDICLPTDLHRDLAFQAFAAGKHVFCEKPIALNMEDAGAMTEAARSTDRQLMVGHCVRFWPEYVELKRRVDSGEHGRLLSLSMNRRTGRPGYSIGDWVNQPERCLGAALDLHIHDADFLLHLLGSPEAVVSQGLRDETGWSSIATQYGYDGRIVTAEGAWNYPANWGFQMRFSAVFERAVLDYDSRSGITLTEGDAAPVALPMPPHDGYHHELAYFIACLERGEPVAISTGEQAAASLDLVLAEIESADSGKRISFNK
ncbi:MAG: Gfo/Idh/MocA family oxidoreductase [Verrucomicrobiota bacterium]